MHGLEADRVGLLRQLLEDHVDHVGVRLEGRSRLCPIRSYPPRAISSPSRSMSRSLNLKLVEPRLATRMSMVSSAFQERSA